MYHQNTLYVAPKATAKSLVLHPSARVLAPRLLTLGLFGLFALPNAASAEALSVPSQIAQSLSQSETVDSPALPENPALLATEEFTIAEIATNSSTFTTLATALEAADLLDVLNSDGPFTIFAPTDEAFAALPPAAIDALLQPENKESLVELLSYHVVPGAFLSTDLKPGDFVTVEGSTVAIDVAQTLTVNSSSVVVADVIASNGVIHIIDRVIIPPSDLAKTDGTPTAAIRAIAAQ